MNNYNVNIVDIIYVKIVLLKYLIYLVLIVKKLVICLVNSIAN